MKIKVTQEDIDKGTRGGYSSCPVALAIRRVCPTKYVSVGHHSIAIGNDTIFSLPTKVELFIYDFDRGAQLMYPFEFDLDYEC